MGVRGLKTLIHRNGDKFLRDFQLHDTYLVIDGLNVLHTLSEHYVASIRLNQFGGKDDNIPKIYREFFSNYDDFASYCRAFFSYLLNCNVTPIVVIDGTDYPNDMKLSTNLKRLDKLYARVAAKDGGVLSRLANITFIEVLKELKIPHLSCIYEADREMAVLAQKLNCPVLSNDSDFFVHELEGGCISATHLISLIQGRIEAGRKATLLPVKLYQRANVLVEMFGMAGDEYILSVFATLGGNDYFDNTNIRLVFPPNSRNELNCPTWLQNIVDWINKSGFENGKMAYQQIMEQLPDNKRIQFKLSVDSYIKRREAFDQFNLTKFLPCIAEQEDIERPEDTETFTRESGQMSSSAVHDDEIREIERLKTNDRRIETFPCWFVKGLIHCETNCHFLLSAAINHRVYLSAQFEKLSDTSSYACAREIRRVIYRIILGSHEEELVEYDRSSSKRSKLKLFCRLPGSVKVPNVGSVPSLTENERKVLLFEAVGGVVYRMNEEIDEVSQIVIMLLAAWKNNVRHKVDHLNALVICIIVLHAFNPSGPNLCAGMLDACRAMGEIKLEDFKKRLRKHFEIPDYLARYGIAMDVVHTVAQFQACYLYTVYLNQVLLNPVRIPRPGILINTALFCNIYNLLDNNVNPKNLLGGNSPIFVLYEKWISVIRKVRP